MAPCQWPQRFDRVLQSHLSTLCHFDLSRCGFTASEPEVELIDHRHSLLSPVRVSLDGLSLLASILTYSHVVMSLIHSSIFERATANFSCPSGGTWYSCASSLFLGCCKSDNACSSVGCAAGNLQPATFDISLYGKIPDQNCPVDSLWYTCTATDPPFIGCCKINPCETGSCPANGLAAAILKADNDAAFSPTGGSSTTSSTTSSASYTTSTSLTSSSTSSSMSSASTIPVASGTSPPVNHHDTPTATIAGASAGGAVGVVAIIAMILYCRRHARKSRQAKQEDFQRRRSFPMRGAVSTCEQPKHSSPHGKFLLARSIRTERTCLTSYSSR